MNAQTPDLHAVVERLERLEKQNRRLKIAGAVALVLLAAVVLVGATTPKSTDYSTSDFKFRSVQVQELILVDEHGKQGKPYAWLGVNKAGAKDEGRLQLHDGKGKVVWSAP